MNDKAELKYQSEILQLTPISSLSAVIQKQLIRLSETIMIPGGNSLFEQGEYSERLFFMLSGEVDLYQQNQFVKKVSVGTDDAKAALNMTRSFSAVANTRVVLFMVERALLERLVILDCCENRADVSERAEWTDQLLSSELMARVPSENIHHLFDYFDEIFVKKNDQIITQNMPGKYFYLIREGQCVVSKNNDDSGDRITLAELEMGGYFGEEALLTGKKRTTSVTITSEEGRLMRLARSDYEKLLNLPTQNGIDYTAAAAKIRDGAVWLDIRFVNEFSRSHITGSTNLPLEQEQLKESEGKLFKEQTYVLYCDIGVRSPFAAKLLSANGIEVSYLKGGIQQYSRGINMSEAWNGNLAESLRDDHGEEVTLVSEGLQNEESVIGISMGEQISAVDQRIRDLKSMFATENQHAQEWLGNETPTADLGILIEARKKMDHIDSIPTANPHEIAKSEGDSELGLLRKQLESAQSHIQKERARVGSDNENYEQKELTLKRVSDELETIKNRLKEQESYELARREKFEQQLATERTKMREQLTEFSTGLERQKTRSVEIEEVRQAAALETKQIVETFKVAHAQYRERQQKTIQMVRLQLKKQAMNVIEKARKAQAEKAQALASLRQVQKQLNDLRAQKATVQLDNGQPSEVPLLVNVESMSNESDKAKGKLHAEEELSLAKLESQESQEALGKACNNENSVRNDFLDWFTSNEQFNLDRENLTTEQKLKLERVKKIAHEALEQAFNGTRPRPDSSDDQFFKNYK